MAWEPIKDSERPVIYSWEELEDVPSYEESGCEICGQSGIESSYPGNDARNAGAALAGTRVLCYDEDGRLVCDDCDRDGMVDAMVPGGKGW